ncbi:Na+/H+ antiporter NhaC [Pseudidiomarina terrestris]|uniref:Na+/H+ antiporter NhaC n=1 Tax=Pseudidiomarina terrestris TaxID=2820060 RepID=A0AAW7QZC2_9GAMM|nr:MULTISPECIES: Na+/H+ antiporter NhaC [unclassified Pseudidiomarina]MDN7123700.1 Na+/H+ antiporter NhaC [Pseudidiomarina sp. 1APP75-32.1]MDN7126510.1 Na+/H+ antiporter NhaC [Pseudidiomarina sp. 1APR75-33.1]MDN7128576.1 Na+/H+ antiporter NhaC [Pseudidiomarina sp. 1APR75-15]MDN7135166.1 Na+/H+ antiporter NhaC [Pseudidiomarina sp. 1ASP75-5]
MRNQSLTAFKEPSLLQATIPLLVLICTLAGSVFLFGEDSSYGPNQIALWVAGAVAVVIGFVNNYRWDDIEEGIKEGVSVALGALLIILAVGSLIGTWLLSGTVPTMIYYGLELLNPSWFYAASALICGIIALAIGSSWTTAATIGVALMGVAAGMELSPGITAGAVVSGAYFGDKMSPLSDTTNLAPAVAGTELFAHIRYMVFTAGPAYLISLVLFFLLGLNVETTTTSALKLETMQLELTNAYNIGWEMLVPLLVLLYLAATRKPALPTVFFGALLGGAWAVIFQPELIEELAGDGSAVASLKVVWMALTDGIVVETGSAQLDSLLSGGGMSSMLNTVWLILSAMTFGAIVEKIGLLQRLISGVLGFAKSTGNLIAATLFTCFGANLLTADQYMAIVIPGRMFREEYEKRGLDARVLSRTLEDSGTLTSALIPWNTCGAFMMGTLAVSPWEYAPFAFFNWLTPLIAMFYGYTGIRILHRDRAPHSPIHASS